MPFCIAMAQLIPWRILCGNIMLSKKSLHGNESFYLRFSHANGLPALPDPLYAILFTEAVAGWIPLKIWGSLRRFFSQKVLGPLGGGFPGRAHQVKTKTTSNN